jgi:hypothetical protein
MKTECQPVSVEVKHECTEPAIPEQSVPLPSVCADNPRAINYSQALYSSQKEVSVSEVTVGDLLSRLAELEATLDCAIKQRDQWRKFYYNARANEIFIDP